MPSQSEKAQTMRDLHQGSETFLIPGPWDVASAKVFEALGFKALATTSGGLAYALGKLDGQVTLEEKVAHCRALSEATNIPITADLENGYADDPEGVAETIRRIAETGVAGGSIEDWNGEDIYDFNHAVEPDRGGSRSRKISRFSVRGHWPLRKSFAQEERHGRHDSPVESL